MQWKLARRSRLVEAYHEWAMRRGFPLLLRIAPRLPRWFLHLGAGLVIAAVMAVYPQPKREIARNLARILGAPPKSRRVRRARRRMLHAFGCYWVDLFYFCQLPYERARRALGRVEGLGHLRGAVARGKGVILLTAHLGNWEVGGVFLREEELAVSVVYVPDQSATAEAFRAHLRDLIGVAGIAIDPAAELSSLPVLRALAAGRVVAMQGDRDFNDRGEWVDFFGAPAPFPLGPMLLAGLTGAALVPTFVVYGEDFGFEVEFGEPLLVPRDGDRRAAARRALGRWVELLAAAVGRWPSQWFTFYDFWAAGESRGVAGGEAAAGAVPGGAGAASSPEAPAAARESA
jgi:Kdo2-lipid IVA lauroyltransferase/acyltransferase